MFLFSRRKKNYDVNIWPGFVDALTALVMVLLFAVLVFVISQYFLSSELTGRNKTVDTLSAEMRRLSLLLEQTKKNAAVLAVEKDELVASLTQVEKNLTEAQEVGEKLKTELTHTRSVKEQADSKIVSLERQMAQLRSQLAELTELLKLRSDSLEEAQAQKVTLETQVATLNEKLEAALNSKLQKMARYQSEFFGKLREALANRTDVIVVGDRFMFQSEVLFDSASATLEENGKKQLEILAQSLKEIATTLPEELNWILRVDGHTDKRPIHTSQFQSNWELSAARAISVVNYLIEKGIPAKRLAAAGFGEHQPIAKGKNIDRNRRIELKIDQR